MAIDPVTGAVIVAGVKELGGFIQQGMQNRARRREADKAYRREKAMIAEQNKYNAPVQQMQRFKDAGLNPHLMYSQGQPGLQTQHAQYQAPQIDYGYQMQFDPLSMLNQYADLNQKSENIKQTQQQIKLTAVQTMLTEAQRMGVLSNTVAQNIRNQILKATAQDEIGIVSSRAAYEAAKAAVEAWRKQKTDQNLNPNDPTFIRMIVETLNAAGITADVAGQMLKRIIDEGPSQTRGLWDRIRPYIDIHNPKPLFKWEDVIR
jgi:hypothetical protein